MKLPQNPFFAELDKIAAADPTTDDRSAEPMNEDPTSKPSASDVSREQNKSDEEREEELKEKKDEAEKEKEEESKEASEDLNQLHEKIATHLQEFGALAKLIDFSEGGADISDELNKQASTVLDYALRDDASYVDAIEKVASQFFTNQANLEELHSEAGMLFVAEKLASFAENEELRKIAEGDEGSFLNKVQDAAGNFSQSIRNLWHNMKSVESLKSEVEQADATLEQLRNRAHLAIDTFGSTSPESRGLMNQINELGPQAIDLRSDLRQGQIGRAAGLAGLAGGALYGGKKLYDVVHATPAASPMQEQLASEEDKVLLTKEASGKLNTDYPIESGGMESMSKQSVVRDFLKIAGAAALLEMTNNEKLDLGIRKEASDQFDAISGLGRSAMDEAFVKTAMQVYTEPQLHEIVAGKHTNELMGKIAFFLQVNDMSSDELTKVAGASGVAAKGVAGALSDAASNVTTHIDQAKSSAEGAGREYIGVVPGTAGSNQGQSGGTGKVGGGLVGGTEGYNVINNPGEYDIEQTAAMLEEAVLAKQAAAVTYQKADAFIKQYGRLGSK